jgi:hypothetical protein
VMRENVQRGKPRYSLLLSHSVHKFNAPRFGRQTK